MQSLKREPYDVTDALLELDHKDLNSLGLVLVWFSVWVILGDLGSNSCFPNALGKVRFKS